MNLLRIRFKRTIQETLKTNDLAKQGVYLRKSSENKCFENKIEILTLEKTKANMLLPK
jgi:hypothetical protein